MMGLGSGRVRIAMQLSGQLLVSLTRECLDGRCPAFLHDPLHESAEVDLVDSRSSFLGEIAQRGNFIRVRRKMSDVREEREPKHHDRPLSELSLTGVRNRRVIAKVVKADIRGLE